MGDPSALINSFAMHHLHDHNLATKDLCQTCATDVLEFLDNALADAESRNIFKGSIGKKSACPLCLFFWSCLAAYDNFSDLKLNAEGETVVFELEQIQILKSSRGDSGRALLLTLAGAHEPLWSRSTIISVVNSNSNSNSEASSGSMAQINVLQPKHIDYGLIRGWIRECEDNHSNCAQKKCLTSAHIRGFRVIDCRNRVVRPVAFRSSHYVALSYVWGTEVGPASWSLNHSDSEIDSTPLPDQMERTIEDAMVVVLSMGWNYLWVDKYCIDQGNAEEFHQQLSVMDEIYASARLSIFACSGSSSHGLPGVTLTARSTQPKVQLNGTEWISGLAHPEIAIQRSLWSSRAWTYQEGVCSNKRLLFSHEQMMFECNESFVHESIGEPHDVSLNPTIFNFEDDGFQAFSFYTAQRRSGDRNPQNLYNVGPIFDGGLSSHYTSFISHIESYTQRGLSYQEDAINALSGICQSYATQNIPIGHYWGIPTAFSAYMEEGSWAVYRRPVASVEAEDEIMNSFAYGLTWETFGPSTRRKKFPTWSWAGWKDRVHWNGRLPEPPAQVPDDQIKCSFIFRFGSVDETNQSLKEASMSGKPRYGLDEPPILRIEAKVMRISCKVAIEQHVWDRSPWILYIEMTNPVSEERHIWCLDMTMPIEKGSELHEALLSEVMDCLILSEKNALVVWGSGVVKERIGLLGLWSIGENTYGPFMDTCDLSKCCPYERREIFLR